jgi:hypothetical protein
MLRIGQGRLVWFKHGSRERLCCLLVLGFWANQTVVRKRKKRLRLSERYRRFSLGVDCEIGTRHLYGEMPLGFMCDCHRERLWLLQRREFCRRSRFDDDLVSLWAKVVSFRFYVWFTVRPGPSDLIGSVS